MPSLKDELAALKIERPPERQSRPWIKWVVLLVIVAAAGAAGWQYVNRPRPIEVEDGRGDRQRAAGAQAAVLNASGYVTARRRATVSSKVTGKVVEVNVEEGKAVREGQVLARLDDAQCRAALALAEAQLEAARRATRARARCGSRGAAHSSGAASSCAADGLDDGSGVDQAQAEVESLKARIDRRTRAGHGRRASGRRCRDRSGRHGHPRAVRRRGVSQGRAAGRDGLAGVGRRRLHPHRHLHDRRHASLEIEVDVNETYINRVHAEPAGRGGARRLSGLADPGARDHDGPDGRSAEGDGARCASASTQLDPRILPDMGVKVTFLREDAAPAAAAAARRACWCRRRRSGPPTDDSRRVRRATATRRAARGQDRRRPTAIGSRSSPGSPPASGWSSTPPPTLDDGTAVSVKSEELQ